MSGTRQYRRLSAETLDTLLRLISEDELTPKQIAERAGVPRQKVYEYRKKLKGKKSAPLTDMATLVIHQRVVFRPDTTIENPEDVNGPSFIDPDSGFDCSRCGQSMSRDWFTIQGNRIQGRHDKPFREGDSAVSNPKVLVDNVSAHSMLRDGKKLLNVAFTDINFAANMLADLQTLSGSEDIQISRMLIRKITQQGE